MICGIFHVLKNGETLFCDSDSDSHEYHFDISEGIEWRVPNDGVPQTVEIPLEPVTYIFQGQSV